MRNERSAFPFRTLICKEARKEDKKMSFGRVLSTWEFASPSNNFSSTQQDQRRQRTHVSLNKRISARPPRALEPDSLSDDALHLVRVSEDEHDLTEDGGGELLLVGDVDEENRAGNSGDDEGGEDCKKEEEKGSQDR